jgi:hypothetical protein
MFYGSLAWPGNLDRLYPDSSHPKLDPMTLCPAKKLTSQPIKYAVNTQRDIDLALKWKKGMGA